MKNFVIVRRSDCAILGNYSAEHVMDTLEYRNYLEAEPLAVHIEVAEGLDPRAVEASLVDGVYHLSNDVDKAAALLAEAWTILRNQRDILLMQCDWTQLADSPLSSGQKSAWATYRQALRDLPENTEDPNSPVWPEQP